MTNIRCDALAFKPTKSQKRVIKRFNKFLTDGVRDKRANSGSTSVPVKEDADEPTCSEYAAALVHINSVKRPQPDLQKITETVLKVVAGDSQLPAPSMVVPQPTNTSLSKAEPKKPAEHKCQGKPKRIKERNLKHLFLRK